MLSPNDIKEQLSLAYLHAVASSAGFSVERVGVDRDSIGLSLRGRPPTVNETSQTVHLSRERPLTQDSLRELLRKVACEEALDA